MPKARESLFMAMKTLKGPTCIHHSENSGAYSLVHNS